MARKQQPIPPNNPLTLTKNQILATLAQIDADPTSKNRVLALETAFRARVAAHIGSLPVAFAPLKSFNTSPFVLMIHCLKHRYSRISEIEKDILPAKEFSSMETSAGRMVEEVTLPMYGWSAVPSGMHTPNSALDGQRIEGDTLYLATLKSGPRCLNDEMSENFADAILKHSATWAGVANKRQIDFTYGVLYGTPCISNKKDWHILRNVIEKLGNNGQVLLRHDHSWSCAFKRAGLTVRVTVRIGRDWWTHLGRTDTCFVEVCAALIRACVQPGRPDAANTTYTISDLGEIVSTSGVPTNYNVALLQNSQLPWLFFLARHFCDNLV